MTTATQHAAILTDGLIGLAEVSRNLGRAGRGGSAIHAATLTRWILTGVLLRNGARLRLRAIRAGSKWLTRMEWVTAFLEAQTADRLGTEPAPAIRTPAERRAASDAAAAQLTAMGV